MSGTVWTECDAAKTVLKFAYAMRDKGCTNASIVEAVSREFGHLRVDMKRRAWSKEEMNILNEAWKQKR